MATDTGKILALDPGQARIGVAVTDESRTLAQPLCVLNRVNRDKDMAALKELAAKERATLLVVGLPLTTDGLEGPAATKARALAKRLGRVTGLPVELVDEWQTTHDAQELLINADVSRKKRKEVVDKVAAALILERYLKGLRE